ncbi:Putative phosphatidylinositol-specific phospholipase C, X domain-containing protein [Septoria linicola]|uniref:Phosphatidylinositol-specific phospholipase C, X domain-containing protein n=1 Tax=Septoria linicola TaxID=215465 RepID=A0A9Q9AJ99_9PEZI|nr:putative phosphatidylinositol-specific phospholipase C, X domain-containing protein [Septoria linicola]USW47188.1 Putative phosphatidylinositol-specific phospholipase C, X domain-containing protein [Septoria linicola]
MAGPLTVRNLTAQPLTIKLVERYEHPSSRRVSTADARPTDNFRRKSSAGLEALTKNLTSLMSNVTGGGNHAPTRAELGDKAESFAHQDVDIRLEPFSTNKTDVKLTERDANDIVRLTLEGDGGGRWRVDVPTRTSVAEKLSALTPDPKHDYRALYLQQTAFVAIVEDYNPKAWMKELHDDTSLAALSIPGTHNSPTYHKALPSVRCQAVSPREQLDNGIRFFDIRVQPQNTDDAKNDELNLVHGVFPISLTGPKKFRDLLNVVRDFLKENPSETVIFSLKREGAGDATDQQLSQILRDHYTGGFQTAGINNWYTEPRVPKLGEVRGKIVVMRRFALSERIRSEWQGRGWGLNAENWAYNTPDCTYGDVRVQDFCEVLETENIDKKIGLCCDHFERAAGVVCPVPGVTTDAVNPVPAGPLYVNFLSASNFWKVGCWPDKIASKLNPAVTSFLVERHDIGDKGADGIGEKVEGDGGVGIVVCDWVGRDGDWDLIRAIITMNSKLLKQQRGIGWK